MWRVPSSPNENFNELQTAGSSSITATSGDDCAISCGIIMHPLSCLAALDSMDQEQGRRIDLAQIAPGDCLVHQWASNTGQSAARRNASVQPPNINSVNRLRL